MPPVPLFLLAPGAGAPSTHPWMQRWAGLLRSIGSVETFDYPYARDGRNRPDPLPALIAAHRTALRGARERHPGSVVLIGKSMGGRIGCHVALEEPVAAVICLSYPLCGGGDPTKLRAEVLRTMTTPVLFVQGTRDPLCPLELLASVREQMRAPNRLHVVNEGDHSLLVTKRELKRNAETQDDVERRILQVIKNFADHAVAEPDNIRSPIP